MELNRRFSKGLSVNGSYTLARHLSDAGGAVPTAFVRFEMAFSNLFNVENLDIPATMSVTSSSFGRINATQTVDQAGLRTIQFSLGYSF
jgi:hypothetical protein